MRRPHSVYSLQCWRCDREVEIPCQAGPPYECPLCSAALRVEWRAALAQIDLGNGQQSEDTALELKESTR